MFVMLDQTRIIIITIMWDSREPPGQRYGRALVQQAETLHAGDAQGLGTCY